MVLQIGILPSMDVSNLPLLIKENLPMEDAASKMNPESQTQRSTLSNLLLCPLARIWEPALQRSDSITHYSRRLVEFELILKLAVGPAHPGHDLCPAPPSTMYMHNILDGNRIILIVINIDKT